MHEPTNDEAYMVHREQTIKPIIVKTSCQYLFDLATHDLLTLISSQITASKQIS